LTFTYFWDKFVPLAPILEIVSKNGSWQCWVKWLKQRKKRGVLNVAGNNEEIGYAKNIQTETTRKKATGSADEAFLVLFGPLPRSRNREERLRASSENKWMFYLSEGPRMEELQAAEGRMAWAGQTLEEIRRFSELKRSCEGHSKAV